MKNILVAALVVLLLSSTAYGGWYVGPRAAYAYYPPAPAYVYGPPVVVAPQPYMTYYPPAVVPARVWVGPPGVVVGPRVYVPGRPVRNVVRAVVW